MTQRDKRYVETQPIEGEVLFSPLPRAQAMRAKKDRDCSALFQSLLQRLLPRFPAIEVPAV